VTAISSISLRTSQVMARLPHAMPASNLQQFPRYTALLLFQPGSPDDWEDL
jgi:hypothetical protein